MSYCSQKRDPVNETKRERMLAIIDERAASEPMVREVARWCALALIAEDRGCDEVISAVFIQALRERWPEATEDEVTRGFNLATAASETVDHEE